MRICVLTTETPHHVRFVQALTDAGHDVMALMETRSIRPPYPTAHSFETERDAYERDLWFGGRSTRMDEIVACQTFADINQPDCLAAMQDFDAPLVVSFGTGLLRAELIAAAGDRLVNLHGGDPEHYRGLDTHLWAIWHRDFAALSTCLHRVAATLDAGEIIACLPVPLAPAMDLVRLRAANTETCINLTDLAIRQLATAGRLLSRPQRLVGRYYSFMPADLKAQCVERFSRYTRSI